MYRVEYLPTALQDMQEIVSHISIALANPIAAERLAVELIEAADRMRDFPYANPICILIKPLKNEYRKLLIQNYIMFYWVDEATKTITIARVIYAKRDYDKLIDPTQ